jgi:hypothetical protein
MSGLLYIVFIMGNGKSLAGAPPGRYGITSGVVLDDKTGLAWQRVVPAGTYTWSQAQAYCAALSLNGNSWRLPSVKELMTIVDVSVAPSSGAPTIDSSAFPGTPATSMGGSTNPAAFWSSSLWAGTYFDAGSPLACTPNTPTCLAQTASPSSGLCPVEAWFVEFNDGSNGASQVGSSYSIRCVH